MDQLKHNAIECLRSLSHKDDVLYQRDHEGSSPCESSPAVLKRTIMPIKKRIFVEAECDLPSTRKRMKNVHDLTIIPRKSSVGDNKNGSIRTITSDSCLSPSTTDQEKPLCGGEKRSIMSVQNQEQRRQENNVSVPKRTLATDVESMDGKGSNEKNKREASPSSPVARQEFSYFKNGQVDSNKFPLKLMDILESGLHRDTIVWASNGKAFAILNPDKLIQEILPQYIENSKIMKFKSFVRKLYRWGFSKVMALSKEDAKLSNVLYVNKQFIKGRRDMCEQIECSPSLSRYERERKKYITSVENEQKHPHFHNDYSTLMTSFHMMERQYIPLTRDPIMIAPQSSQSSFRSEDYYKRNGFANHVNLSQNIMIGDQYIRSVPPNTNGYHHNLSSNMFPSSSLLFNTQNFVHEMCVPQHENLNYFKSNHFQGMGNGYMSCEEVRMQMQNPRQQMSEAFANSIQDGSLSMGFTYPSNSMDTEHMYHANRQKEMRLKMQTPQLFPKGM